MARKIKIQIISEGKKINWIPSLRFGVIKFFLRLVWRIGRRQLVNNTDNESQKKMLSNLTYRDIVQMIHALETCEPFQLVEVEAEETYVNILVL